MVNLFFNKKTCNIQIKFRFKVYLKNKKNLKGSKILIIQRNRNRNSLSSIISPSMSVICISAKINTNLINMKKYFYIPNCV